MRVFNVCAALSKGSLLLVQTTGLSRLGQGEGAVRGGWEQPLLFRGVTGQGAA